MPDYGSYASSQECKLSKCNWFGNAYVKTSSATIHWSNFGISEASFENEIWEKLTCQSPQEELNAALCFPSHRNVAILRDCPFGCIAYILLGEKVFLHSLVNSWSKLRTCEIHPFIEFSRPWAVTFAKAHLPVAVRWGQDLAELRSRISKTFEN